MTNHPIQQSETHDSDDEISFADAIAQISDAIRNSHSPMIAGLENLSTQAQQAAFKLARLAHASVDSSSDNQGRGNLFALQKRGRVTASLGEIKSRSQRVVFWFCDPLSDHPEFLDKFVGNNCQTITVDSEPTTTSQLTSRFITLPHSKSAEAIWLLRALIGGHPVSDTPGLNASDWSDIANELKLNHYGAIFWGSDHTNAEFDLQADGIHAMIRELNQFTRFVGIPYRNDANGLSAENVSTWSSGYPAAINWNRQRPRHHWLEYSDLSISEREEWDFLLLFEGGQITVASQRVGNRPAFQMCLPIAEYGMGDAGDFCRLDDVNLRVDATEETELPKALEVIQAISESFPSAV